MTVFLRGLLHAVWLFVVSMALGVVVGGLAALGGPVADRVGATSAGWYWALALLLPLGLWGSTAGFVVQDEKLYEGWGGALGIPLIATVVGTVLTRFAYIWAATFGAALLSAGKLEAYAVTVAINTHFNGLAFWVVLAVTLVGAFIVGAWAHERANAIPFT
jgi:hypothetical protein